MRGLELNRVELQCGGGRTEHPDIRCQESKQDKKGIHQQG